MERDITGRAVQSSARIIGRVMERVQQKVPLGPGQVNMSNEELRKEVRRMKGEPLMQLVDILGDQEVMDLLRSR